jgi:hypothetical protein
MTMPERCEMCAARLFPWERNACADCKALIRRVEAEQRAQLVPPAKKA